MDFKINSQPPTADAIRQAREDSAVEVAWKRLYIKIYSGVFVAVLVLALMSLLAWKTDPSAWFDNALLYYVSWELLALLGLSFMALDYRSEVLLLVGVGFSLILGALLSVLAWPAYLGLDFWWAGVVLVLFSILVLTGNYVINSFFSSKRNHSKTLKDLSELNIKEYWGECVDYDRYVEIDAGVKQYHQQLIEMKRKPCFSECMAARRWVDSTPEREAENMRTHKAEEACARLMPGF